MSKDAPVMSEAEIVNDAELPNDFIRWPAGRSMIILPSPIIETTRPATVAEDFISRTNAIGRAVEGKYLAKNNKHVGI